MSSLPRRSVVYSQNFLKSSRLVASLLDRCTIGSGDIVYEIGPGKGIITAQLARRCQQVIAIEKDPLLAAALQQRFARDANVTVYEGDFLQFRLPSTPYKVCASIPFNITTAIVTRLTTACCPPEEAYLTMQREAANKFLGQPRASLYAVLLKPWFELEIIHRFRRGDFIPEPRVDVVMLRLRKRGPPLVCPRDRQPFRDFVVYGFTAWRPTIKDIFKDIFTFKQIRCAAREAGIDLHGTPSLLTCGQWLALFNTFKQINNEQAWQIIKGSEQRLRKQQEQLQKIHRTRRP
jgi:23S rRNA (adenine-N6)-dimethyltransferase